MSVLSGRDYKQDFRIVLRVRPSGTDIDTKNRCLKVLGDGRSVATSSNAEALNRLTDSTQHHTAAVLEDLGWVRVQRFAFDRAYDEFCKQSEFYADNVRPLVFSAVQVRYFSFAFFLSGGFIDDA